MLGLGLGTLASIGMTKAINAMSPASDWPVVISVQAAIIALMFSMGVGVFFGFFPAYKASRMNPIDALRYE